MIAVLDRTTLHAEVVPIGEFVRRDGAEWDALALLASEPNSFAERWFVTASVLNLDIAPGVRMLVVRDDAGLVGLLPIAGATRYGRMRARHVENWLHYHAFLGTPLVRAGHEDAFWSQALAALDATDLPGFVHLVGLTGGGSVTRALLRARPGAAVVHRCERALLDSDLSPAAYYETVVRKKKRKEIGRLRARLAEMGAVVSRRLESRDALDEWTDAFLMLEASGWKGRDGAALGNEAETIGFLRATLAAAFDARRLDMLRLDVDGRAVAMLINFVAAPGSFSFKIAYDEAFARFSPGVLIQLDNLGVLDRADIGWMDSCAAQGHPMINSLWAERREIVRVSVPLDGLRRRATFAACRALETASERLRALR